MAASVIDNVSNGNSRAEESNMKPINKYKIAVFLWVIIISLLI
jgi:hypothetical protein